MGLTETIFRLADPYDRQARLYPALLAISPAVLTVISLYGVHASLFTSGAAILASCGMMFWLANLARDRGKSLEAELFRTWGGRPSVQLLRYRDTRIDTVTKQRYHAALGKNMSIEFPSPEMELNDPGRADATYESATKWLLERTRDTRHFPLLFKENISYGFRRNMLGVRPYGASIAIAALLWALGANGFAQADGSLPILRRISNTPPNHLISIAGTALLLIMWLAGTTKERVRIAAFAYAERLLAACEAINGTPSKAKAMTRSKENA